MYELLMASGCDVIKNEAKDNYNIVKKEDALKLYGFDWEKFTSHLGMTKTPNFFITSSLNYIKCGMKIINEKWIEIFNNNVRRVVLGDLS